MPVVQADPVWIGTVERGEFVREVRGSWQRDWFLVAWPALLPKPLCAAGCSGSLPLPPRFWRWRPWR